MAESYMEQVTATRREAELSDATSTDPATKEVRAKPWGNEHPHCNDTAEEIPAWKAICRWFADKVLTTLDDRSKLYGDPLENHELVAALDSLRSGFRELPIDVCWRNIMQKIARNCHTPSLENLIDIAGYVFIIVVHMELGKDDEEDLDTYLEDDH